MKEYNPISYAQKSPTEYQKNYIEIPIYSEEQNESGDYDIIDFVKEYI